MHDVPSPDELIEARRIIRRLHRAVGTGQVRDMAGMDMWDGLVEGGRAIAVTTAYLAHKVDTRYGDAWERMMESDD